MAETIITVEGAFDHHHPAERGTVHLRIGFEGPGRTEVVGRTTALHGVLTTDIQAMYDGATGPVTWWSSDRLQAWSERPWNNAGKQLPLVHHAAISLAVKFSDLSRLAGWVEATAGRDGVAIPRIEWTLTELTRERLTTDARHRAVRNAVETATSYATSLGLTDIHPTALAEPGMLGDETRPRSSDAATTMMRSAAAQDSSPVLDLKPEDITVSARVHARFAAS